MWYKIYQCILQKFEQENYICSTNFLYLEELPKLLLQLFFQINSPIMMYIIYKKDDHFPTNNLDQLTKLFKY